MSFILETTPFPSLRCSHSFEAREHVCITHHYRNIWFIAAARWHSRLMHLSSTFGARGGISLPVSGYSHVDFYLLRPVCSLSPPKGVFMTERTGNVTGQDLVEMRIARGAEMGKTDINQRLGCISRATLKSCDKNGWKYANTEEKKSWGELCGGLGLEEVAVQNREVENCCGLWTGISQLSFTFINNRKNTQCFNNEAKHLTASDDF